MDNTYLTLVGSAAIAVVIAAIARQRGWSIALPLVVAGCLVGLAPIGPSAPPDPEIILVAILAPLVFGEALSSSYLDLRKVSRPVLALAIGLVIASTFVVGVVAAAVVAMPIGMALALGAVLSPTDAVAVAAVARRASLPRRLVSILEGESLVNDGTGLTALKVALVAAAAGTVTFAQVTVSFIVAVVVAMIVGGFGGWVLAKVLLRSRDLVASNALILVAPFVVYVVSEELNGSGILAIVIAALVIAHSQNSDPGHTGRVQSAIVWKNITFVLQALAFFLVGLELPDVIMRLNAQERSVLLGLVAAVVVTLIVVRTLFVFGMVGIARGVRWGASRRQLLRGAAIVSWAGARGPVSGLAAFSIPLVFSNGEDVPFRDLILATTFVVVVITLLLSMTLAPLARALKIRSDDDEATLHRVDVMLARAALERLNDIEAEAEEAGTPLSPDVSERLRADMEQRLQAAVDPQAVTATQELELSQLMSTARAMVRAEQEELLRLRDEEGLPDAIVRPKLRTLDLRLQSLKSASGQ